MEAVLLVLVCASPWVYGAVHPGFEFLLDAGVGLVLLLWGVRLILEGELSWKKCPVAVCLAGLFLVGICQIMPLPRPVLGGVSPTTTRLYSELIPPQAELLPNGERGPAAFPPAGTTLSLYPGATRRELGRLLAVFLVFAAVRNNIASPAALRRLCVVAVVNGTALSLFALFQLFTSPRNTLYWSYESLGQVFGPFINRNHFSFYVNLCIGLGVGLLVSRRAASPATAPDETTATAPDSPWLAPRGALWHDPTAVWICAALAIMVSTVLFSLSRGGVLALGAGMVVYTLTYMLRRPRSYRLGAALAVGAAALALASWFGLGLIMARLGTLWGGQALENRLPVWSRVLPAAGAFPVCGTGLGTFRYVEPMYRSEGQEGDLVWDHAHNDYLELLVEGGAVALALAVFAVGAVFFLGFRAARRHKGSAAGGLALGCLIAFTTLVVHSFGEFGIHVPAITLLAAILCAHLCSLGASQGEYRVRLGGVAPATGAAACLALALLLGTAGWKAHRVERLRLAAAQAAGKDGPGLRRRIACLARAASLAPDDAELQFDLGYARALEFERQKDSPRWDKEAALLNLTQALRNYLLARDACPLLAEVQMGLATYADRMKRADVRATYLGRVKLLAPGDPESWYLCGLQELEAREPERAWASWRRSLELSETYLIQIAVRSARILGPQKMLAMVLPDRPDVLLAAASRLYPEAGARGRRPFLDKALRLLEAKPEPLALKDLYLKAQLQKALGQKARAVADYRALLAREPEQVAWRFELARFLYDLGRLRESRRELLIILAYEPKHSSARELLKIVTDEITRQE
jgi:O-antigen ligase